MMHDRSETSCTAFLRQDETIADGPEVRELRVAEMSEVTYNAVIRRSGHF